MLKMKRVYDTPGPDDGFRVLVDRIWPRGLRREAAALDAWYKELAPSTELRKWYAHDVEKWPEFQARYQEELKASDAQRLLQTLRERGARDNVTLLYAAHAGDISNAAVLLSLLEKAQPEVDRPHAGRRR